MDEETKAEFEEMQKSSALGKAAGGEGAAAAAGLGGFDFASWMAGTGKEGAR